MPIDANPINAGATAGTAKDASTAASPPAQDTLDRLEAAGARVFRTDEQGDVSCKLTADRIEVDTLR